MPEQIYIGNFAKGLINARLPFNIDNDAFPFLYNFYLWRGRAKRKRGTVFLGQLQIQIVLVSPATLPWQNPAFSLIAAAGNFITQTGINAFAPNSTITPGSINIMVAGNTYTEPSIPNGTLIGTPVGTGTINYATGDFTITGGGGSLVTGNFSFYPNLPVMGLQDFVVSQSTSQFPVLLAFDTKFSYQLNQTPTAVNFYRTSFYKKSNFPVVWSGQDFQLFWTTNYNNALWATNNKPGFNFVNGTYISGSGTNSITFNFKSGGVNFGSLFVNDVLFFNEWATGSTINGLNGIVTASLGAGNYIVQFTTTVIVANTVQSNQIAQMLTNQLSNGNDGIKWYDGDPTSGTGLPTITPGTLGWVNFAPPLTATSASIDNETSGLYYLVGALAIVPFKDRLVFFSPWIQLANGSAPIQLIDTALWSWNGTPYYNALVPDNETFNVKAYYVDQTGLGGYLPAGISQPILSVTNNEDVLIVGFGADGRKTRFVYTGNDLSPFLFFTINSELPSSSPFSTITLDKGGLDIGTYGITMTDQQSCQRIDLEIPDEVFQIQTNNNGMLRVNAARDFQKEWVYFSYPVNASLWKFPTQTLLYNYREITWAIFYENFTVHGNYRKSVDYSWLTIPYDSWDTWSEPWNSGATSQLIPNIIAGNPQGYVLIKAIGTGEGQSGTIAAISSNGGNTQITSTNHCVTSANPLTSNPDYLFFQGALGTVMANITNISQAINAIVTAVNTFIAGQFVSFSGVLGMTQINVRVVQVVSATGANFTIDLDTTTFTAYISGGTATIAPLQNQIGRVIATIDANNFVIDIPFLNLGYIGLGTYTRLSQPLMQTKQFPIYWQEGRQVRLSVQKYLMDMTPNGEVTLNIYLSQDPFTVWNLPPITPDPNVTNSSLIYSQVLFTCPESTNIGLTPANTNLQMPTAQTQKQIWHRVNTSLIGDTFQIGITLNDAQMKDFNLATSEITLHGIHLVVDKGPQLA